jgi:CRISPR-associated protein Csm4
VPFPRPEYAVALQEAGINAMTPLRLTLALRAPLGTPLVGDTLFGQVCHAVLEAHGNGELKPLLDGYTNGKPWLVVGDGFPSGYLPRPTIPAPPNTDPTQRKAAKGRRWIPMVAAARPLPELLAAAQSDEAVFGKGREPVAGRAHHNTLNRLTGTTGTGEFTPYTMPQTHFAAGQKMDVWCVLDENRCDRERLGKLFADIGATGYGRDASIGLGKFDNIELQDANLPMPEQAQAWWTLGPCAPQGQRFDGDKSHWRVLTRFGRHGGALALSANPFKKPVLLAGAGAVLVSKGEFAPRLFVGQGLSGMSHAEPATVHQGYAPVLALQMETG